MKEPMSPRDRPLVLNYNHVVSSQLPTHLALANDAALSYQGLYNHFSGSWDVQWAQQVCKYCTFIQCSECAFILAT